jgi:hypothetical protein
MIDITDAQIAAIRRSLLSPPRDRRPANAIDFKIRPISEDWMILDRRPALKTATCNVAYIWRDSEVFDCFGSMPRSFAERRFELRGSGLLLPSNAPLWSTGDYRIWQDADDATRAIGDPRAVSAWHLIAQIPDAAPVENWCFMTTSFLERELVDRGAAVAWAVHGLASGDGGWIVPPHMHAVVTARHWKAGPRKGQRHCAWIASTEQQLKLGAAWRRRCATVGVVAEAGWGWSMPPTRR